MGIEPTFEIGLQINFSLRLTLGNLAESRFELIDRLRQKTVVTQGYKLAEHSAFEVVGIPHAWASAIETILLHAEHLFDFFSFPV